MPDGREPPLDVGALVDPRDGPERENQKLRRICAALMARVEQAGGDGRGAAYGQFQRAVLLEDQVRERTRDLEQALDLLNESNARLASASRETERARADLAGAIETIEEGFALFDPDDRLVLWNSHFCLMLPDVRAALAPGLFFAGYVDRVSRSAHLARGSGLSPEAWARDRMARHGEARVAFTVQARGDAWLQVSELRMAAGQTVIMQTDVSSLVRAEREEHGRALGDQARLIRATLEHLGQGVCMVGPDGRIAAANRSLATLLALPPSRLRRGARAGAVLDHLRVPPPEDPEQGPCRLRAWRALPSPRPPFRADLRANLRMGPDRWLDVFAAETPGGGLVLSVTDVSAERLAARALGEANERLEARVASRTLELEDALAAAERANASRTRFVAAASHDLLQPLSAAKLYLASAEDEAEEGQRETLGKAQNALAGVQAIIEALLDIARLESARPVADLRPVDLGAMLGQLADDAAPAAALKGLSLRVRPLRGAPRVLSDPSYLRRILQNLIGNAVRYTEAGGVLVGVRRRGGALRIGVWDTGPGIAEEDREAIFREFHRLGRRASASEGLGLGLAIVDRACALLGHPLSLRSRPGRGSLFVVEVPLAEARPLPRQPTPGAAVAPPPRPGDWRHEGLVALVVENDLDMRRAMALLLRAWAVEVHAAASGSEAMALVAGGLRPGALLVDHQLDDGGTGLALIAALRARLGPVPARLVTADRAPALREAARRGGVEILPKPVDPLTLHLFLGSVALRRP